MREIEKMTKKRKKRKQSRNKSENIKKKEQR